MRLYIRSQTISHGLSLSCTIAYRIIHGHGTRVSFFKSFKNHTRLSLIHSNGPSVTRIRPQLVQLYGQLYKLYVLCETGLNQGFVQCRIRSFTNCRKLIVGN